MEPFVINKQMLMWLCLYPLEETISNRKKVARIVFSVTNVILLLSLMASSTAYFVKFVSIDLEQSMFAVLQFFAFSPLIYIVAIVFLLRHKIPVLRKNLSDIYQEYEKDNSFKYLARANNQSEWFCKIYLKYALGGFFIMYIIMTLVSVLICWLMHGELDAKYLFRPGKLVVPWDQTTLLGYFFEVCFVIVGTEFGIFSSRALLFLFVSICLHHRAFYQMFQDSVHKLNRPDKNRDDKELLCKLINFQNTIKKWFSDSADLYSLIVLVHLICMMILTACAIFHLELILKHIKFEISLTLFVIPLGFANIFLYCFLGKIATDSYANMADCLCEYNWHELSLELQKYFILMIPNAQKPVYYHGFQIAILDLETFCKLLRAMYTYYMILKTLTSEDMHN